MTFLHIDRDKSFLEETALLLADNGHMVVSSWDPLDGVCRWADKESTIDLIICDYFFDKDRVNGIDILRTLREGNDQTPFILYCSESIDITGLGSAQTVRRDRSGSQQALLSAIRLLTAECHPASNKEVSSMRILYYDADEFGVEETRHHLEENGHEVVMVTSAGQAFATCAESSFQAIVVNDANSTGIGLLEALRQNSYKIPFVFYTDTNTFHRLLPHMKRYANVTQVGRIDRKELLEAIEILCANVD